MTAISNNSTSHWQVWGEGGEFLNHKYLGTMYEISNKSKSLSVKVRSKVLLIKPGLYLTAKELSQRHCKENTEDSRAKKYLFPKCGDSPPDRVC